MTSGSHILLILGGIAYLSIISIANYYSYTKFKKMSSPGLILKDEFDTYTGIVKDDDLLVVGGLTGLISWYVVTDRKPQLKFFVPPQTPNGRALYIDGIIDYITSAHPKYILCAASEQKVVEGILNINNIHYKIVKKSSNRSMESSILYEVNEHA